MLPVIESQIITLRCNDAPEVLTHLPGIGESFQRLTFYQGEKKKVGGGGGRGGYLSFTSVFSVCTLLFL